MPAAPRLQANRYELKYLIDERRAHAIRDFAMSYLDHDPYALGRPNFEYPIYNLYLDSDDLALCRATMSGDRNRFKLRIRTYDRDGTGPAFFEIKRRVNDVICKERSAVRRDAVDRLLAGHWPRREDLVKLSDQAFGALQRFCELRSRMRASGTVHVAYLREAYCSQDSNAVRLTFDRGLRATRHHNRLSPLGPGQDIDPGVEGVILELKFTDRFPVWMREMVRIFNLERRSMAKYVTCVHALAGKYQPTLLRHLEVER